MSHRDQTEHFVAELTAKQNRLYAYIMALLPNPESARDVLQETNMVLWRKSGEFVPGTDFGAWAAKIAYFQVLSHRKRRRQDRHVFDDGLLADLAQEVQLLDQPDDRQQAMRHCLDRLPGPERELVRMRYADGGSVKRMADHFGRSVGAVSQSLYRIRQALTDCIELTLRAGDREA
jgi:RNA polymerase sigma-70 factor (ECF subfamily)